jgi:predicted ATPase
MKYRIGLKNFKQFKDYKSIDFNELTFLIGKNNSGKSSIIKALILFFDYIKSDNHSILSLKTSYFNLGIIENVLNFEKEDEIIYLELFVNNLLFTLELNYDKKYDYKFNVLKFKIQNKENLYTYDFLYNKFIFSFLSVVKNEKKEKTLLEEKKFHIDFYQNKLSLINQEILFNIKQEISGEDLVELSEDIEGVINDKNNLKSFLSINTNSTKFFNQISDFCSSIDISYFQSKNFKTSNFHLVDDHFDSLSNILKKYIDLGINDIQLSSAKSFIEKWIDKDHFNIGDKINIINHSNEAFELKIIKDNFEFNSINLGTGSIQCLALLLTIANVIHLGKNSNKIIFIEEPEQNLHPNFQSKLAELFYEVSTKYEISIFIETHSEYIIRKCQLIGKQNNQFQDELNNPFCIIYFDKNNEHYQMKFREDGKFINEFGTGFFDESTNLAFELF